MIPATATNSPQDACPQCQGAEWAEYPKVRQCVSCGHMESKWKARASVIEQQYTDAAQHSAMMGDSNG